MDEDQMTKKLLVVGDSFMRPDPDFPGQHWSEMLSEYNILMYSQPGATNGIILQKFYKGLKEKPDAIVFGFTEPNRIEFSVAGLSSEQKLTADLYRVHACEDMALFKSCAMVRSALLTCEQHRIPYAWTLNLLFANLSYMPFSDDHVVKELLGEFFYRLIPTNLATYRELKSSPGFHTDDPVWQNRFANESRNILQSIDFSL